MKQSSWINKCVLFFAFALKYYFGLKIIIEGKRVILFQIHGSHLQEFPIQWQKIQKYYNISEMKTFLHTLCLAITLKHPDTIRANIKTPEINMKLDSILNHFHLSVKSFMFSHLQKRSNEKPLKVLYFFIYFIIWTYKIERVVLMNCIC